MIVIFYDRANNREVSSKELMSINLVETIAVGDTDEPWVPTGRRYVQSPCGEAVTEECYKHMDREDLEDVKWEDLKEEKTPMVLFLKEKKLATLGYKSKDCPKHQNWDRHTNLNDLVFLRLEDEE